MKQNHVLSLLQTGYTTVEVTFAVDKDKYKEGVNKLYTYKTNLDLKPDNIVVVPADDGFNVVRVINVHPAPEIDTEAGFDYKWVVDKIDLESYAIILEEEAEALKQLRKLEADSVRKRAVAAIEENFGSNLPKLNVSKSRL